MDQQTIDVMRGTQAAFSTQDALIERAIKHGWLIKWWMAGGKDCLLHHPVGMKMRIANILCGGRGNEWHHQIIIRADCTISKWPD